MKEKIALITDTGGDLTIKELKDNNIFLSPFIIRYGEKEYKDTLEISPKEIYERLHIEMPSSSLPNLLDFDNLLTNLENQGYTNVIVITISTGLSGTYNSLRLVCENHPNLKSFVYDSKGLTVIEGQLVLKVAELIRNGLDFEQIVNLIPKIRAKFNGYFTIDTLEYLQRGGRIGRVASSIGTLLQIKPIIGVAKDGVLYTHLKARGKKKALAKMTELLKEVLFKHKCNVWVLEGGAEEEARDYMEKHIKGLNNIEKLSFGFIGPICGMNTGPGLVAVVYEILDN
ncbi:DegV family protein [Clostridium tarantellae]|uniref:DegV family EDD domain-containing protein n=1 Tax=Clostridium tarantellae TaxID=39493 RepID=A0A6I1MHQ4_9CLOT|nr:DegV family protein [Clostridium tarantellae]MPQ42935.1 DegV family EDD domain-containing protein [Clostridium tarantellae]